MAAAWWCSIHRGNSTSPLAACCRRCVTCSARQVRRHGSSGWRNRADGFGVRPADEESLYICCASIPAMARERLPPWHERQRLPNGRELLIRPIRPEDAEPLRAGFPLLQPEEVRQRFLHAMRDLTPEMAERFSKVNPKTEF